MSGTLFSRLHGEPRVPQDDDRGCFFGRRASFRSSYHPPTGPDGQVASTSARPHISNQRETAIRSGDGNRKEAFIFKTSTTAWIITKSSPLVQQEILLLCSFAIFVHRIGSMWRPSSQPSRREPLRQHMIGRGRFFRGTTDLAQPLNLTIRQCPNKFAAMPYTGHADCTTRKLL